MSHIYKKISLHSSLIVYAISISLAFSIAVVCAYFFASLTGYALSLYHGGFIIIATLFTSITTKGTPIRQGVSRMLVMMLVIAILFLLIQALHPFITLNLSILVFILGAGSAYLIYTHHLEYNHYLVLLLFATYLMMVLLIFPIPHSFVLVHQLIEVLVGASIGISMNWLILAIQSENKFRQEILPALTNLMNYSDALSNSLLSSYMEVSTDSQDFEILSNKKLVLLSKQKVKLETLFASTHIYPEWSFEIGFNPGLRSGYRFFLIHIERIIEIFFALEYIVHQNIASSISLELSAVIMEVLKTNRQLLEILHTYFVENVFAPISDDLHSDITELENALQKLVPQQIELLDMTPHTILLIDLVRYVKDIRELLMQLLLSLPNH